jgi:hypothetical protein
MASFDTPAFLNDPPVYDELLETIDRTKLNDSWSNWFDDVVESMGQCITHDFIVDPITGDRRDAAILMATGGSITDRNNLENARNGSIWYNTDTDQFNFRQGGSWVTFTPIPA